MGCVVMPIRRVDRRAAAESRVATLRVGIGPASTRVRKHPVAGESAVLPFREEVRVIPAPETFVPIWT